MTRATRWRSRNWRIWRRRLVASVVLAVAVIGAYLFWLRDSSLVEVREVEVTGVTANRESVVRALESAALDMTTLHVRVDELVEAVDGFPTVGSISVDATPLHKLEIEVRERLPVALASDGREKIPVAEDGYLLRGLVTDDAELPRLAVAELPSAGQLGGADAEGASIAGRAPEEFRPTIEEISWDEDLQGVVVSLERGPELRFGDGEMAESKWAAVAAVLADPELGSPGYVDVSIPDRPVSGG